ncbi:hypothetical protein C8J57DRAFT_1497904 [Mycena rebaudengoi]|nr:hypothetical protein C8J57DRAFT_1497904 [Mycena rebaudengoi]
MPSEILVHALSFVDEYDPPLSVEESVRFRGVLRLSFPPHLVNSVPCLWARMLVTPTTQLSQILIWLEYARSFPLDVHVRAPSARLYYSSDHDGFTLFRHFRHLLRLLSTRFSTCRILVLEVGNIGLVKISMEELAVANPAILSRLSVVMENEYPSFSMFQPSCLASFVFPHRPPFGQPFLPVSHLSIVCTRVQHPVFTHIACDSPVSVVQLPRHYSLTWRDLIHLLSTSLHLHELVLDAVQFSRSHAGTMIASPPLNIRVLDITFRGLRLMAEVLTHIPFPYLSTLKVHFQDENDVECLATCSGILNTITELILFGQHPVEARVFDIFRFCMALETLDMRQAEEEFFVSFFRASGRMPVPGFENYNACPFLQHLLVSGVSLIDVHKLLEMRDRMGFADLLSVTALQAGEVDLASVLWFQARSIDLHL